MVMAHEELHSLIDKLPEAQVKELITQIKREVMPAQIDLGEWLEQARLLRAELDAKYGQRDILSAVDLLNEAREERLHDLMGGE